jgi:hypothetical protein
VLYCCTHFNDSPCTARLSLSAESVERSVATNYSYKIDRGNGHFTRTKIVVLQLFVVVLQQNVADLDGI